MIHGYHYKPTPMFRGKRGQNLFFGFELEIETSEVRDFDQYELAEEVRKLAPFCYCKRDGSISNEGGAGFEVVSHPLSWPWIKKNQKRLAKLLDKLDKAGARSYDTSTCGLHVHLSKAGLGDDVIKRMLKFVFGNPDFIHKISRRKKPSLNQWAKVEFDGLSSKEEAEDPYARCKPRRLALNTLPPNTVEFRIFRGTLSMKGFMRCMEFCQSLVQCIKQNEGNVEVKEFGSFVHAKEREYPNLSAFLRKHRIGIGTATRTATATATGTITRHRRDMSPENAARPTAMMLNYDTLVRILNSRNSGMTWGQIEEDFNLRRTNGMTAYHAYQRANRVVSQTVMAAAMSI